jgi:hypothetical protein
MGLRFRRSIGWGPLRFTLTPKGISKSIGIGPFRLTKRADGKLQTTTRIPGTGLSYVATEKSARAGAPVAETLPPRKTAPRWLIIIAVVFWTIVLLAIIQAVNR